MKRRRAERHIVDTAVQPYSNASFYDKLGRTAEKLGTTISGLAQGAKEVEDLSILNESTSLAVQKSLEYTNQWKLENEGNPRDPQKIAEYNNQLRSIWATPEGLTGASRSKWSQIANQNLQSYQRKSIEWGIEQSVVNTEDRINDTIKTNLSTAKQLGFEGSFDEALEAFDQSYNQLYSIGTKVAEGEPDARIGKAKTEELLQDYKSDYMKSYIMGAIEKDPNEGLLMLQNDKVRETITDTKDVEILVDYAKAKIEGNKQIAKANDWASQREFDQKVATGDLSFEEDVIPRFEEGNLSPESLKKYTKLAGGRDPLSVETNYIKYNQLFMDIVDLDNPDIRETYKDLNKAFLNGELAVQDYGSLLSLISPDYYQAVNKNHKMDLPDWKQGLVTAIDRFRSAKEDYGIFDSEMASMSKKLSDYVAENPKATTRDISDRARVVLNDVLKAKYPDLNWTSEKQLYTDKNGTKFYLYTDKDGNLIEEVVNE